MRGRGHLHRVTIGRTREVRGPDSLERAAVGVIIFVVMIFAIGFGARLVRMVESLDAVSLASGIYYDEIIYRSVHGTWPPANHAMVGASHGGRYARNIRLDGGGGIAVDVTLPPAPASGWPGNSADLAHGSGVLSFRPELLGTRDYPAFVLLCGHAKPIASGRVEAADRTTVHRKDLPPFCR